MIGREPEMIGWRNLAEREKRDIEQGRTKLEDAMHQPHGARLEGGRLVYPGDAWSIFGAVIVTLFFVAVFSLVSQFIVIAVPRLIEMLPKPQLIPLVVGLATPLIAEVFYRLREITLRVPYALAEIALGAVLAGRAFLDSSAISLATWLALAAGIMVAVDGRARFARVRSPAGQAS